MAIFSVSDPIPLDRWLKTVRLLCIVARMLNIGDDVLQ